MDLEISRAWRQAAADLGIRVEAPVALITESGETVWFEAHVLDFGGPKGAIVAGKDGELGGIRKVLAITTQICSQPTGFMPGSTLSTH